MKQNNPSNESPDPISFASLRASLRRLWALEGKTPPPNPGPLDLATQLAPRYDFLPKPLFFEVNGDDVVIKYPDEPASAKAEAQQLSQRALERKNQGDYAGAACWWRRALEKQPSWQGARRDLAHAYFELGDFPQAKPLLLHILWCDPDNAWALAALGNIAYGDGDSAGAERYLRLALAIEPQYAPALNNLAVVCASTGRSHQAVALFKQAINLEPQEPYAHYGLARTLAAQGKCEESVAATERLFAIAKPQGEESAAMSDSAQRTFLACQQQLVRQNHPRAKSTVRELRTETEKLSGCPIRITYEKGVTMLGAAGVLLAWDNDCDHHVVQCQREGAKNLRPHLLASALLRIQAEAQARTAGQRRLFDVNEEQIRGMLSLFDPLPASLGSDAIECFAARIREMVLCPLNALIGSAPPMLVEARLRQRFPVLRPAQFLALAEGFTENWQAHQKLLTGLPRLPQPLQRPLTALMGLDALYLDWLFEGVPDYAARYRRLDGFELSQSLWQHWQSRFPTMKPGDEFAIIDDFADILGLAGRYEWLKDHPLGPGSISPSTPGR